MKLQLLVLVIPIWYGLNYSQQNNLTSKAQISFIKSSVSDCFAKRYYEIHFQILNSPVVMPRQHTQVRQTRWQILLSAIMK